MFLTIFSTFKCQSRLKIQSDFYKANKFYPNTVQPTKTIEKWRWFCLSHSTFVHQVEFKPTLKFKLERGLNITHEAKNYKEYH